MLPVEVAFVSYDARAQLAIVFLRERRADDSPETDASKDERRLLPIWIGTAEAYAIYAKIEGKKSPRPMTHDLMADLVASLGGNIRSVTVHSLVQSEKESIFYGRILLEQDGKEAEVDSRPSDAIALALRANAAIYVAEDVMREAAVFEKDIIGFEKMEIGDPDAGESVESLETLDEESYDEFKV